MVDAMLGGLARWLRILGFDAAYDSEIADEELVRRSLVEGRHILSRDRLLPEEWRVSACTILEDEGVEAQLRAVVQGFRLRDRIRLFSRCTRCNTALEPVSREDALARAPARVGKLCESFARCPACHRIYWEGSHTRHMRNRLQEILES